MSRALSIAARRAMFAQETQEVFTLLCTISHAELAVPIRVANDMVRADANGVRKIVSRGQDFICYPFAVDLPSDDGESAPRVTISIDNIDREIVKSLRAIASPVSVRLEVVITAQPDLVEAGPFEMTLVSVDYDAMVISGELTFENILTARFPGHNYTPNDYPGLH